MRAFVRSIEASDPSFLSLSFFFYAFLNSLTPKGNGANVVRIIPNYALKFTFNDTFKAMVMRPGQSSKDLTVKFLIDIELYI